MIIATKLAGETVEGKNVEEAGTISEEELLAG
jgi:hypothetical protein